MEIKEYLDAKEERIQKISKLKEDVFDLQIKQWELCKDSDWIIEHGKKQEFEKDY